MKVEGKPNADLLVIGWGGTHGHLQSAVNILNEQGKKCAFLHFNYICPMPRNAEDIIRSYKKVVVCELNSGQLASYLRTKVQGVYFEQYNKIEAQPFSISELVENIGKLV